eukprot:9616934-Ditylum_brightwellii.AAC.1
MKTCCPGREGAQWTNIAGDNGTGPCPTWIDRYEVAKVYLAWVGCGKAILIRTSGVWRTRSEARQSSKVGLGGNKVVAMEAPHYLQTR